MKHNFASWCLASILLLLFVVSGTCDDVDTESFSEADMDHALHALKPESDFLFWHLWNTTTENDTSSLNVSGVFRGTWQQWTYDERLQHSYVPHKSAGLISLTLKLSAGAIAGVDVVQGRLRLHDGADLVGLDCYMKVEGMYVHESGRLHASLQPQVPVLMRTDKDTVLEGGHRSAQVDDEVARTEIPVDNSTMTSQPYLKALREAADRYQQGRSSLIHLRQLQGRLTECEFQMELEGMKADMSNATEMGPSLHFAAVQAMATQLSGAIYSENCNVSWSFNATSFNSDRLRRKSGRYSLLTTFLTASQHLLVVRMINLAVNSNAVSSRMSVMSVGIQSVIDAYLCLLHLTFALVADTLFTDFAMVALFQFVLFALLEMRLVLHLWRVHRGVEADMWNVHRELSMVYTRFYAALLSGVFAAYQLYKILPVVLVVLYSWWIPQIVHSARHDSRQPLSPSHILFMSLTRLALPLYFYGCPDNLMSLKPSLLFCVVITLWVGAQCGVLILQYYRGPRAFIPKRLLPPKYDYFRPANERERGLAVGQSGDEETGHGSVECVICMCPVETLRADARMVTPCGHFFHPECLERWMDVKMECPTCRSRLPQP